MSGIYWYIWKPDEWQRHNGFAVDLERCRFGVWSDFVHHQCSRKPTTEIDGFKFCTQHAKMIKKHGDR